MDACNAPSSLRLSSFSVEDGEGGMRQAQNGPESLNSRPLASPGCLYAFFVSLYQKRVQVSVIGVWLSAP